MTDFELISCRPSKTSSISNFSVSDKRSKVRVEVFGFDVAEASQIRRIRALKNLGYDVRSFTMRRDNMNKGFNPEWPNTHLGETKNEALWKRAFAIAGATITMVRYRERLRAAEVIIARNLDMLLIASLARWIARAGDVPLVYECLDVHRTLCGKGAKADAMRALERRLLEGIQMLVVSSPGFIHQFFAPIQGYKGPWALWENKLPAGANLPKRPSHRALCAAERPLRLGWIGTIRCAHTLTLLSELAQRMGPVIEVHVHGVIHRHAIPDFYAVIASHPNMTYHGPYTYPDDLPEVYRDVDVVWAQDLWQSGANSDWLLPNRIYEASWAGCPSLAVATTETGRRILRDRLGWVVEKANARDVQVLLERLARAEITAFGQDLLNRPEKEFVQSPAEIFDVVEGLRKVSADERPSAPMPVGRVDPASILVAIPTFNEEHHIATTIGSLLEGASGLEATKIVIADGGSTDATRQIVAGIAAQHSNVHLIDNPARRQAAAINLIVETQAEPWHTILVRVDAHANYPPGYILTVAEGLLAQGADALVTVLDSTGESCFQKGAAWASNTILGSGGSRHRAGWKSGFVDHGHHAGFRLEAFRRLGGYDTESLTNEDAEFDHRLGLEGGRIWLDASIRVNYIMRPSLGALSRQYWHYGNGRAQTLIKHRARPHLRQMIPPAMLLINVTALIGSSFAIWLLALPLAYILLLLGGSVVLVLTHRSACAFWAGPALFAMHMSWGAGFCWKFISCVVSTDEN